MKTFDKFYALSAPVRREILTILSDSSEMTSTAISRHFEISAPAISQHLKVLLSSDLVTMHKQAQERIYALNAETITELESWANELVSQLNGTDILEDNPNT